MDMRFVVERSTKNGREMRPAIFERGFVVGKNCQALGYPSFSLLPGLETTLLLLHFPVFALHFVLFLGWEDSKMSPSDTSA